MRRLFGKRLGWIALTLVVLFRTASAHDPMTSSAVALFHSDSLELQIKLGADIARSLLDDRESLTDDPAKVVEFFKVHAADVYRVSAAGVPLVASKAEAQLGDENSVELRLVYARPANGPLLFEAIYLKKLPADHTTHLAVLNEAGDLLWSELLTSANLKVEVPLSAGSPVASGNITDRTRVGGVDQSNPSSARHGPSFKGFFKLGVEHILKGYDHLLFLCGLLVVCRRFSSMATIITCFTVAHSLTLALAALDVLTIPGRVVEPMIAASIVYVGVENLVRHSEPQGRWALTFAFGLIHGFGFAGVLKEIGLGTSGASLLVPLFSFNLGVEVGQLAVTAVVLPLFWVLRKLPAFAHRGVAAISLLISMAGAYWLVQRLLG